MSEVLRDAYAIARNVVKIVDTPTTRSRGILED